jgi:nitroreductase
MDALEALFTRRSVRQYTDEPISKEDVKTILEAGMNAPSANNRQPWQFIVVDDRAKLNSIMQVHPYSRMLAQAPMAIIVCADTNLSGSYWQQDCSAATENILLAARALNLGTVWLGVYPNKQRVTGIKKLFNIPKHIEPLNILALGHPAVEQGRVNRYDPDRIHTNTW